MQKVMQPFIIIYHIVSKVLSFPSKIFKKSRSSIEEGLEDAKLKKEKLLAFPLANGS